MRRASHALADDGDVWLIDPVDGDGLDERLAALGTVRGVIQLFKHHPRDCAALAGRYGVPLRPMPRAPIPGAPFQPVDVAHGRWWDEVALWWPERRVLVVTESLGTTPYYLARGERLGVHPLRRLTPPRILTGAPAEHLLPGHGAPVEGPETPDLIRRAVTGSRSQIPRWLANWPAAWRMRRSDGRQ
jgi:hypothetical protein